MLQYDFCISSFVRKNFKRDLLSSILTRDGQTQAIVCQYKQAQLAYQVAGETFTTFACEMNSAFRDRKKYGVEIEDVHCTLKVTIKFNVQCF